ncbi:DUF5011 domain-containing protein [Cocleimonas sp. KMM 6892]|uniref:DUF5011 domain-containing protein n=1 Tax=unclassified Cocleimonas TaxID=2639732 RepID=UPI002DBBC76C|nr:MULTISPECIES: DUF5011 domain-containing protein [unclassified Cocleimonas]MEB8430995.1 DUF5011 domain-containing protein [Cocleimonas sp. KMM 6892]MEC4714233.1 DUF5011 domain-containing protein [Cocleimonas sp. KMM 6895]MEC4743564.1 DUF5011 domain-containing protein [Cocleimonas sp. KMM 6896]
MIKPMPNVTLFLILIAGLSLSACGGGGSTNQSSNTNNSTVVSQPKIITQSNLQTVDMLARSEFSAPTVTSSNGFLTITHTSDEISDDKHFQFFLNTDNNPDTGFRFDSTLWDDTGADYVIEDGLLFEKNGQFDSAWTWNVDVGDIEYTKTSSSISAVINQNLLTGLTPQIRVGFVIRDENWNVLSIWPGSSLMAQYSIDVTPPVDTTAPVISLNGASTFKVQKDTVFNDPGATATDNIDGNLTNSILATSNVDTSQTGTYSIVYKVTDQAGNQAEVSRTVIVLLETASGIAIDGSISDWQDINVFAETSNGTIKVTDSYENLYVMIDGSASDRYTQLFLDVDNNSATGFQFSGSVWNQGGADYMVENRDLSKSKSNDSYWSWDYHVADIIFSRQNTIIEMAIPKSSLENLGDSINLGFVYRDADWNTTSVIPESNLSQYILINNTPGEPQVQVNEVSIVSFCGSLWGTDGSAAGTTELFEANDDYIVHLANINAGSIDAREYKGNWYTLYKNKSSTPTDPKFTVLKYDGQSTRVLLDDIDFYGSPAGEVASRSMTFYKNDLYYIDDSGIWKVALNQENTSPVLIKRFSYGLTELASTNDYIIYRVLGLNWSYKPSTGKHELLIDNSRLGFLAPSYVDNLLNDGNIAYFLDKTDATRFYQTDGTAAGTQVTTFDPSSPRIPAHVIGSSATELWIEDTNGLKTILGSCD